ncbi:MFS transporter [Caballeronia ptereochthonis]|uniref:Major facilitator transporter n=1 Tax=Caballeronia ptereochthonis TaxID=1777144 RepID=A0A158AY94_9BURK|nr:MFS transporter [Caballeronia ptereochthonis]SAK62650.1 major facilitator transporter [Caballeronia ptereochthonis]
MNVSNQKFQFASILFVCWFASYLERFLINMALPFIGAEFKIDEAGLGLLLSVFFVGYAIIQLPGGWLADKIGTRKTILFSVGMFAIFTAGSGLAWSLAAMFVIRFLFGIFEGCFPTAAYKAVAEGYAKNERARVQSFMLATNPLSLVVAPLIAVPLIAYTGWRGMFIGASAAGLVAFALYFFGTRRSHPAPSNQPAAGIAFEPPRGFRDLIRDSNIWKISVINFGVNILIWGFLSWLPSYMIKVQKLDLAHAGFFSALPGVAGIVGMLAGGWLADKAFAGREKYLLLASVVLAGASLFVMLNVPALPVVIACQLVLAFSMKISFIALWSLPLKLIEAKDMGMASGIVNLGSQLAGVASPAVMGFLIVARHGSYDGAFTFLAACTMLCAIVTLTLPGKVSQAPILQRAPELAADKR